MAGNANSGRRSDKPFATALRMELAAAGDDFKALRMVAAQLINQAANGDLQAIKELVDRTDGKPAQSVTVAGDEDNPLHLKAELDAERFTRAIAGIAARSGTPSGS